MVHWELAFLALLAKPQGVCVCVWGESPVKRPCLPACIATLGHEAYTTNQSVSKCSLICLTSGATLQSEATVYLVSDTLSPLKEIVGHQISEL